MPHANRPLMGAATVAPNPEVVQAQSPHSMNITDQGAPAATPAPVPPETPTHDWEKRYKDLQSYATKKENEAQLEIANLQRSAAQGPKFQIPKTADELAAFQRENPENFAFIQSIAHGIAENSTQALNDRLETAESSLADTSREMALAQLKQTHPDFEEINGHPAFQSWLGTQDTEVQSWIYHNSNDAAKVSRALSLFKQDTGWGQNTSDQNQGNTGYQGNQQLDASMAVTVPGDSEAGDPRTHPKYMWSESEIGSLHPTLFAKYADDINLAWSENRVALS